MAKIVAMTDGGQRSSVTKPPVVVSKGIKKKPQPIKGTAVDRLTSVMETDGNPGAGAVGTDIRVNKSTPQTPNIPNVGMPKITGVVPTTSNSVTNPVQSVTAPAAPQKTAQDMIQEMVEAQRNQRIAELQAALEREMTGLETSYGDQRTSLDTAKSTYITNLENALRETMSHLDAEQAKVQPYYYDARNQAASQSDIGALNFAQYMASRGVKGGAGGMPEIYRQSALQGQIGALDQAEAANLAEIDRHRSLTQGTHETNMANVLNNYATEIANLEAMLARNKQGMQSAYEQDLAAAQSGIDAQALQAYINQMNTDRTFGLQEAELTGTYQGSPTLQKQMWQADVEFKNKQLAIDQAYKNGQLSLQRAAAARAANNAAYQKEKDRLNRELQLEQWEHQKDMDIKGLELKRDELNAKTASAGSKDLSGYMSRAIDLMDRGSDVGAYVSSLPISTEEKNRIAWGLGY